MKKLNHPIRLTGLIFAVVATSFAQSTPEERRFLNTPSFNDSPAERAEILALYKDLRLTDVADGMDAIGLQDIGQMDREIRSLWRDAVNFSHRAIGFAVTLRYVPTNVRVGQNSFQSLAAYEKFKEEQYAQSAPDKWRDLGRQGNSMLVIDASGAGDVGFIGSNNSLGYAANGFVGVVTNGNARDTDEIVKVAKIPVYTKSIGRGIRPGRILLDCANYPVNCGGVLVFPGDLVMADGDGVIVVPRAKAKEVALVARGVMQHDQQGRARLYKQLGLPVDETVKDHGVNR